MTTELRDLKDRASMLRSSPDTINKVHCGVTRATNAAYSSHPPAPLVTG